VERIDLQPERVAERGRWRNGGEWDEAAAKVAVGELTDGRWYVRMYGAGFLERTACAYAGPYAEHYARGTARRWMRTVGGGWVGAGPPR
jgi:hypothetical protein